MLLYRLAKWMERRREQQKANDQAKTADKDQSARQAATFINPSEHASGHEQIDSMEHHFLMMKEAVEQFQENMPHAEGRMN
jgi:hypothetical protein